MPELGQKLKVLSEEDQRDIVLSLENHGRTILRQKEISVNNAINELSHGFFSEMLSWASLHSERWQQIQAALLDEKDLHIENADNLQTFVESLKEGLVPLDYVGQNYFDFRGDNFITLTRVDGEDGLVKTKVEFDMTKTDEFMVDGILDFGNLIPENFLNRLIKYLEEEEEEIPF